MSLWQKTIEELKSTGKNQVLACLQNCTFMGMDEARFVVGAPGGVIKGLIERLYKKTIEKTFNMVSGLSLQMICQEITTPPEPKEPVGDIQEDVPPPTDDDFGINELDEVKKQRLDTAIGVFGDGLVHPEEVQ